MNELIVKNSAPPVNLPAGLAGNRFAVALAAKRLKECQDIEILAAISSAVEKAWFDLGLKPVPDDDLDQIKINILTEAKACFTTLTLEEIKSAIHLGARGKYGEVFGITVIGVAKWFAAYMTDQSRAEALQLMKKLSDGPAPRPTAEELSQARNELTLKAFAEFKARGKYFDYNNLIYNHLDSLGLVPFSNERKKEFIRLAIKQEKEKTNPLLARNFSERENFRKALREIIEKEETGTLGKDAVIIAEAKRIALLIFFKELGEMCGCADVQMCRCFDDLMCK